MPLVIGLHVLHEFGLCIDMEDKSLNPINIEEEYPSASNTYIRPFNMIKKPFTCCSSKYELFKPPQHFMNSLEEKLYIRLFKRANH